MTGKTRNPASRASKGAERVAKCYQKRRMLGGHQLALWIDKDAVHALQVLKDRYKPLSATKIIGHLIKVAAKMAS